MSSTAISRRVFLKGSGGVLAGTLAFTSGPIALLAPSTSWAMPLDSLSTRQGDVLLAAVKHIFPHPDLEDAVYAHVVESLDKKSANSEFHKLLHDGINALNDGSEGDWLALDKAKQLEQLTLMSNTPFFQAIRSDAVVSLYDNPLAYAHFGYGGTEGDVGYLHNGFSNLTWLPEPQKPEGGYLPNEAAG
ncbi:twin-arginine translocation signal domain-containing protein [Halomonas sp. SpR8]|uniref:twin-arginine translocation signal domain-containing protein n=1 Tax=Halomonas sp. SpR8 TaxID=3050463 RepID=UPI0027E5B316|nr:twin-arginine translocation signal domain-containing protein [Halomonas sp. SpR8]MDQ7729579.1 twin-arginine translocation signal domain-containing protein [Halomonas sp. SpR8]